MESLGHGFEYDEYSLQYINRRLIEAQRDDLVIISRAEMVPVDDPEILVNRAHNFAGKFRMPGLTKDHIIDLAKVPKVQRIEDLTQLWEDDQYPGASLFNFGSFPAFTRMVILYPHFTVDLINKINKVPHWDDFRSCQSELMKAYNLMSNLVDISDFGIRREDGSIDERYLLD